MHNKIRATVSVLAAVLFLLTIAIPDWIERTFAVDPDQHGGGLEKALSAAALLIVLAVTLWPLIRRLQHRRLRNFGFAMARKQGARQAE